MMSFEATQLAGLKATQSQTETAVCGLDTERPHSDVGSKEPGREFNQ